MPARGKGGDTQESEGLDRTELESIKRVFERYACLHASALVYTQRPFCSTLRRWPANSCCRLDRKNDGKIDRDEIAQQFDILGYQPKRQTDYGTSEVEDMIWEVDEVR